jgi:class 3 adenylate cyclase
MVATWQSTSPGRASPFWPENDAAFGFEPAVEAARAHFEKFLSGLHGAPEPDRALAAILFTDIVGSTERAAVGDREWRNLLETEPRRLGSCRDELKV